MPGRLVERFAVGTPVDVRFEAARGLGEAAWAPAVVVAHAHPGIWVAAADGSRWFVTNGARVRVRATADGGAGAARGASAARADGSPAVAYKIASLSEWESTERTGVFPGSPADLRDGYVHLSTAAQVRETAAKHFTARTDLVLLDVALDRLDAGTLRWEPSRGGALFPHVHGPLRRCAVARVRPLPAGPEGRHEFPRDVGA